MVTEAEEKFLSSGQEALRLSIALERGFAADLSPEWRERYRAYLMLRFRPAMEQLIREGAAQKAARLLEEKKPGERELDGLIRMAAKAGQTELLDLFLRWKRETCGFREKTFPLE